MIEQTFEFENKDTKINKIIGLTNLYKSFVSTDQKQIHLIDV